MEVLDEITGVIPEVGLEDVVEAVTEEIPVAPEMAN